MGDGGLKKRLLFLSFLVRLGFFVLVMFLYGLSTSIALAGTITGISYGGSGDVVGTYIQASQADFVVFSPATALAAAVTVEVTFPAGTTLTNANLTAADFLISQGTQGLCTTAGSDTAPSAILVNEGSRTITFTLALASISKTAILAPCGLGQMTIKTSGSLSGNEIRNPTTTTTTGTLSIVIGAAVDSGSISNVAFIADAATTLAFTTQPSATGTAGQNLATQPVVTIRDQYGNTVTGSNAPVTLSAVLSSDTSTAGGGTLNVTTNPLAASAGVATFAGVNYTKAEAIKLKAVSSGLPTVFSNTVTVSAASANKIGVSQQPSSTATAGQDLAIQPVFLIQDEFSNTVTSDNSTQVTIAAVLASDGTTLGSGVLSATVNPVTAAAGVVTFAGVDYTKAETIKLKATAGGLTQALTNSIIVSAGAASSVVKVSGDGQVTNVNGGETGELVVRLEDSFANPVSGGTVNFVISSIPHGAVGQSLSRAGVTTNSEGLAASTLKVGNLLGVYQVTASGSGAVVFLARAIIPAIPESLRVVKSETPICTQMVGVVAPRIYGASPFSENALFLYFTPAGEPNDRYAIEYGVESGRYIYGADRIGSGEARSYLVRFLVPNTDYYFRVRGGNGCATGLWSNEFRVRTGGLPVKAKIKEPKQIKEKLVKTEQIETSKMIAQEDKTEKKEETQTKKRFIWKLWRQLIRKL